MCAHHRAGTQPHRMSRLASQRTPGIMWAGLPGWIIVMGRQERERNGRRKEAEALWKRLTGGLSEGELKQVAATALMTLKGRDLDRVVARLGPETAGTLKKLMADRGRGSKRAGTVVSGGKVRQEWDRAWDDWWACVDESTHEGGRYSVQEHHWEAPYLDTSALGDLEPIAARLRALVGRVMAGGLDPEFGMAEALKETVEEAGAGLPEWMEQPDKDIAFGSEVTKCLVEWESGTARREGLGAYDLVRAIRWVELSGSGVSLDSGVVAGFIDQLDESGQKAVLEGIDRERASEEWAHALSSAYSPWFLIHQELCGRWDPPRYLQSCRDRLSQDWRLALPVLTELSRSSAFEGAARIAEEAVRSLLRLREGEAWDPLTSLLVRSTPEWFIDGRRAEVGRLFKGWLRAAEALGRVELGWALKMQLVTYTHQDRWDEILDKFKRIPSPRHDALRIRLFSEWTSWLAEQCAGGLGNARTTPESGWVQRLAEAVYSDVGRAASFRGFLDKWLREAERTAENLRRARPGAAMLTLDLDADGRLRRKYPALYRVLSVEAISDRSMAASRRRWLGRCKAKALLPQVIAFWERNVRKLVPDPADASYDDCAAWLAVLEELDRESFARLVAKWTETHRRRKNLWKALADRGMKIQVRSGGDSGWPSRTGRRATSKVRSVR